MRPLTLASASPLAHRGHDKVSATLSPRAARGGRCRTLPLYFRRPAITGEAPGHIRERMEMCGYEADE
ncbi:hypothetical protein [Methylobacterium sp. CM6244]